MIPLVDLQAQYARMKPELDAAVLAVMQRGDFILGSDVADFESEFASFCGAGQGIGCASGTDALQLACRALEIGPGDEVILPAFSFIATALGPLLAGAQPVLVDVDEHSGLLDPDQVVAAITPRTRALLPVHLYGQLANMPALRAISEKHDLALIEDAAQAHGAVSGDEAAGRAGTVACFSFYPGKNLGAYGDGGMLTTNDRSLAERLRRLRNYGSARKYHHQEVGLNSRLDSLQAAVLRVKLRRLAADNARRREIAARYDAALADLPLTLTRFGGIPVYHLYVVRSPNRDRLLATLNAAGIGAAIHYPKAIHQHQAFSAEPLGRGVFPQAERWARECLSLPVFPEMSDAQVDQVADALRAGLADAAA